MALIIGKSVQDYSWDLKDTDMFSLVTDVYTRFNKPKIKMVTYIIEEYRGQKLELLRNMCDVYKLSEETMQGFVDRAQKISKHRLGNSPSLYSHTSPVISKIGPLTVNRSGPLVDNQPEMYRRLLAAKAQLNDRRMKVLELGGELGDDDGDLVKESKYIASGFPRMGEKHEQTSMDIAKGDLMQEPRRRYRIREKWLKQYPSLSRGGLDSPVRSMPSEIDAMHTSVPHLRSMGEGSCALSAVVEYPTAIKLSGRRRLSLSQLNVGKQGVEQRHDRIDEKEIIVQDVESGLVKLGEPHYWSTPASMRESFVDNREYEMYKPTEVLQKYMTILQSPSEPSTSSTQQPGPSIESDIVRRIQRPDRKPHIRDPFRYPRTSKSLPSHVRPLLLAKNTSGQTISGPPQAFERSLADQNLFLGRTQLWSSSSKEAFVMRTDSSVNRENVPCRI